MCIDVAPDRAASHTASTVWDVPKSTARRPGITDSSPLNLNIVFTEGNDRWSFLDKNVVSESGS